MKCEYCGTDKQIGEYCEKCGAPLPKKQDEHDYRYGPQFYNGYIVYEIEKAWTDVIEVQFWLGCELIERFELTRDFVRERVPECCDEMSFFWDLFLLARGEKDVLEWKERNNKYPATFLVTRVENPEKERFRCLSMRDLAKECVIR